MKPGRPSKTTHIKSYWISVELPDETVFYQLDSQGKLIKSPNGEIQIHHTSRTNSSKEVVTNPPETTLEDISYPHPSTEDLAVDSILNFDTDFSTEMNYSSSRRTTLTTDSASDSDSDDALLRARLQRSVSRQSTTEKVETVSRQKLASSSSSRRQHSVSSHKRTTAQIPEEKSVADTSITSERVRVRKRVPVKTLDADDPPAAVSTRTSSRKTRSASVQRSSRPVIEQTDKSTAVHSPPPAPAPAPQSKCPFTICSTMSIDYYRIDDIPTPISGTIISSINGQTKTEKISRPVEEKQYVRQVIKGPTHPSEQKKTRQTQPKVDTILASLFIGDDDSGLEFFTLDFAIPYIIDQEHPQFSVEVDLFTPSIASFDDISSSLIEQLGSNEAAVELIHQLFNNRKRYSKSNYSLTSLQAPPASDVAYDKSGVGVLSPGAFFEFRFGKDAANDRLHIFTWHNMGIPASQIARNLISFVRNVSDNNVASQLKAVTQYVFTWIYYFAADFYEDSHCADLILQLSKLMTMKSKSILCHAAILRALISSLHNKVHKPDEFTYSLQKPVIQSMSNDGLDLMDLTIDPSVLAIHLTYIELELVHKLQRSELVHNNWNGETTYFKALIDRFNETVAFIASSILVEKEKSRAKNIQYWIQVMKEARELRSYQLVAEIDAALSCLPITRMKSTWKLLKPSILTKFQSLHNLCEQKDYIKEVFESPRKTVPYIGIFMTELARVCDEPSKKKLQSGSDGYNISMHRKCFSVVEYVFMEWGFDLSFELDSRILEECRVLSGRAKRPEDLILPSVHFEPMRPNEGRFIEKFVVNSKSTK